MTSLGSLLLPNPNRIVGDVTVTGDITISGTGNVLRTPHDARWFRPGTDILRDDAEPTYADLVTSSSTDNAPPYFAFDGAAVERIKWVWTPDEAWIDDAYSLRVLWLNPTGAGGNVRWRHKVYAHYLNNSPTGALTTVGDQTFTAPSILGLASAYNELATAIPIVRGALGEAPTFVMVVDRFATDAADTLAGDAGIEGVSVTRIDV